jgi:outer membrane biosynthesis protein TonB
MRLSSLIACIALAPMLIAASRPVRLQPTTPWDVDYAADSCRLIRVFGDAKSPVKLAFESTAPKEMDMLVAGKPLRTFDTLVAAKFLPLASKSFEGTAASSTMGPVVLWSNIPMLPPETVTKLVKQRDALRRTPDVRPPPTSLAEQASLRQQRQEFATAATEIEIDTDKNHPVILETGSLGPAIAAFDKCSRDSLKDWGVDPDVDDKIVRPPWPLNAGDWLSSSDYPDRLVILGKESHVNVRLLVDASGKVTKCTSLSHYDEDEFKRITCAAIVKRARFAPAEIEDGTKVPSYYTRDVVFRIAH